MTGPRYKVFGVYLSEPVYEALADHCYEAAGVMDLAGYFEGSTDTAPAGDPGADATDELVAEVVADFADLYDAADFDAARDVAYDSFVLVRLAAEPTQVSELRERFRAAETIQDVDLRTVHTAILGAFLETAPA